VSAKNVTTQQ